MDDRIGRIIRRTKSLHVEALEHSPGRERRVGQLLVRLVPNVLRRIWAKQCIDPEATLQFEVRPMVERIAQGMRNGRGPCQVLFLGIAVSGNQFFGCAICPHRPPFVMIAFQPNLRQVGKPTVLGNLIGGEVVVKVEDRLVLGVPMVECDRFLTGQ